METHDKRPFGLNSLAGKSTGLYGDDFVFGAMITDTVFEKPTRKLEWGGYNCEYGLQVI